MKTIRQIGLVAVAVIALLSFGACSADEALDGDMPETLLGTDDEPAEGALSGFFHIYFKAHDGYHPNGMLIVKADYKIEGDKVQLEFLGEDMYCNYYPTPLYKLSISYRLPEGQTEIQDAKIAAADYDFVIASDNAAPGYPVRYETHVSGTKNSPLVIKKVGESVSVYINKAYIKITEGAVWSDNVTFDIYFNKPMPYEVEHHLTEALPI